MDRPRHPHVIRTWVVERTRHPVHNIPAVKPEDQRRGPQRATPSAKPPQPHKETPEQP